MDDKWLATLDATIRGEIDRISQSLTRRVKELAEGLNRFGVKEMQSILTDEHNAKDAICATYRETAHSHGQRCGTVCSLVMDLPRRQIHIAGGNPVRNGYKQIGF